MLSNISACKDNQTMKFGQVIRYDMKNFFLENYTQNMVLTLVPSFFLKIKIEQISG